MSIYNPDLFLSTTDRELLRLLGELVLSLDETYSRANYSPGEVPLSPLEARKLLELLEEFVNSRKFIESAYLTEKIFGGDALLNPDLRDIYLSWRKRVGRSRAVATIQWENLLRRLGISVGVPNPRIWYRANAEPMPFEYFIRMEAKLADAARVHPRVKTLIMKVVEARRSYLEEVRFGRKRLPPRTIADAPTPLLSALKGSGDPIGTAPMSTSKLVGIMTIVMDCTALYTTRDWSVTAFLSTIAGAVPPTLLD